VQTIAIVLTIGRDMTQDFEQGFQEEELAVWNDLHGRGTLVRASLTRLDISSRPAPDAVQYLVVAVFATDEGHHEHDDHPGFKAWNERADAFQVASPLAFGGDTILAIGN
jgi:hypothetical protein